jgi:putative hydrolase of the HAD superfamily
MRAILFDLDDTLVVGKSAAVAALEAVTAVAERDAGVDGAQLQIALPIQADKIWSAGPEHSYCAQIGLSPWEGLWCNFEGPDSASRHLGEWAPTYRREAWAEALALQGVVGHVFADRLAGLYAKERRARHQAFDDAHLVLATLRKRHVLGLVTNGAACLQREKLEATELGQYFQTVVVSADIGVAKPDPAIFRCAVSDLGIGLSDAVMVGDNQWRDVEGATALGMAAVWLNRRGEAKRAAGRGVLEIPGLSRLPTVIKEMGGPSGNIA